MSLPESSSAESAEPPAAETDAGPTPARWRRHAGRGAPPDTPPTQPTPIVLLERDLAEMLRLHTRQYPIEVGGVLLGRRSDRTVIVSGAVFPLQLMASDSACAFDVRSIDHVHRAVDGIPDEAAREAVGTVVGWVHSHPRLGVFLSEQDHTTLAMWTGLMNDSVAMVIDPHDARSGLGVWGETGLRLPLGRYDGPAPMLTLRDAVCLAESLRRCPPTQPSGLWTITCGEALLRVVPGSGVDAEGLI